jgi:hypothetical protein
MAIVYDGGVLLGADSRTSSVKNIFNNNYRESMLQTE